MTNLCAWDMTDFANLLNFFSLYSYMRHPEHQQIETPW
jgi:hypothetical protein